MPGVQICEVFPKIAARMDKCVVIRSLVGASGGHDAVQCMSGWATSRCPRMGGRPSLGAAVARIQGAVDPSVPPFVGLAAPTQHMPWSDSGTPGFLGSAFGPFKPDGPGMANLTLKDTPSTSSTTASTDERLRRPAPRAGRRRPVPRLDAITDRALGVLTSSRLLEALDLSKESDKVRERYGDGKPYKFQYDGAPTVNDHLLVARRLVEAGARVRDAFLRPLGQPRQELRPGARPGAKLDQGLSALIDDLEARGMLDDVTVVAWGEFGRTPRINKDAGRDHWPQVSCACWRAAGCAPARTIGATNRLGEYAKERPVAFGEVFATLYHNLGLDPETTTINDPTGRPQHLTEQPALRELV